MTARENLRRGIRNYAGLSRSDKKWVTSKVIRDLSLLEMDALDEFIESMLSARFAIRRGISVFLSHSSKDKPFVRPLAKYLREHGLNVWLDEADLMAGESLVNRVAVAIDDASFLVAVLSRDSVKSSWVRKELALAVNREIDGAGVTVVPIVKDECEMPRFLADKLYLDFRTSSKRSINRPVLVDTLMRLARKNQLERIAKRLG